MSTKRENLLIQIEQAEAKKKAVSANTEQLQRKLLQIQKQIAANNQKVEKLNFFLEKTQKTLQGN